MHSGNITSRRLRAGILLGAVTLFVTALTFRAPPAHPMSWLGQLIDEGTAEFGSPWGLTTDEFGDVYVVDEGKHRISKFDGQSLQFEWAAGSFGSGQGQLAYPNGIAVGDGLVYVADTSNHRVAMFTTGGSWAGALRGEGEYAFAYPADVDFFEGRLYVAEGGARCRVQMIEKNGSSFSTIGTLGGCGTTEPHHLYSPTGVEATTSGVFVADPQAGVVKRYLYNNISATTIGSPGSGPGQLDGPFALAVMEEASGPASVWVVESGLASRVQKFTADGQFVTSFGGTGQQGFTFPHGIALSPTGDRLYVSDTSAEDPNVYVFLDLPPKLDIAPEKNLKRLGKTDGIWLRMVYNQATKTCNVLAKATVDVPGHPAFTVEDDFKVRSIAKDYKIDVSDKQGKWLRKADQANKKVAISLVVKGPCSEGARVSAKEDYKAG